MDGKGSELLVSMEENFENHDDKTQQDNVSNKEDPQITHSNGSSLQNLESTSQSNLNITNVEEQIPLVKYDLLKENNKH